MGVILCITIDCAKPLNPVTHQKFGKKINCINIWYNVILISKLIFIFNLIILKPCKMFGSIYVSVLIVIITYIAALFHILIIFVYYK